MSEDDYKKLKQTPFFCKLELGLLLIWLFFGGFVLYYYICDVNTSVCVSCVSFICGLMVWIRYWI